MLVQKRDKSIQVFDANKIKQAIIKANKDVDECYKIWEGSIDEMVEEIIHELTSGYYPVGLDDVCFNIEEIQDAVELCLQREGYYMLAKKYIKYRYQRQLVRDSKQYLIDEVSEKLEAINVQNQNANLDERSFGGRMGEANRVVMKDYALNNCMSEMAKNNHLNNEIYIHDLDSYAVGMHNCYDSDTAFVTNNGVKKFKELCDGQKVVVVDKYGNWKDAIVKRYGKQKMYELTFKSSLTTKTVCCTRNHRWVLEDGSVTDNIQIGDSLYMLNELKNSYTKNNELWCFGFVLGDGSDFNMYSKDRTHVTNSGMTVRLCNDKTKYKNIFMQCGWSVRQEHSNGDVTMLSRGNGAYKQLFLDNKIWKIMSHDDLCNIFNGYLSADGHVCKNGSVMLSTSDDRVKEFIEYTSSVCGYYVWSKNKKHNDTNYKENRDIYEFYLVKKQSTKWTLVDIKASRDGDNGYKVAWCVEEPTTNTFTLDGGMVTGNCLSVPFDKLLANGFNTRQTDVRPANSVSTAFQLVAVIFQLQSLQQFGGVSATHLDWTMVPYVRKSFYKHYKDGLKYINESLNPLYKEFTKKINDTTPINEYTDVAPKAYQYAMDMTIKECQQAVEGMYHNLNTLQSRSGNQLPFTSINYGTCTLPEGRMVTKALLEASIDGIGKLHKTSIFPCGIFQCMKGVNRKNGEPNYDLYQLALKSTAQRLYPNYANVDWSGNEGYDIKDPRTYFSTMGCRTANGYDINGFGQLKDGRGNICPVTIIMPTLAMEADKDVEKFMSLLDVKIHEAKDMLLERFEWICSQPMESAKFMYENGTMEGYVPEEGIRSALKHGTLALGQLGLAETLQILIGKDHTTKEGMELAKRIEQLFKDRCNEFKNEYKLNFGVYYTPAENLCYTAMEKFKNKYGVIDNVSDKDFFTNSIHVPVWKDVDVFTKIDIESQLTGYSSAGCITYVELDSTCKHNLEALEEIVNYAMDKDIPYFAINVPNDTCLDCAYCDEFNDHCPMCGSENIQQLRRVTGYLTGDYKSAFNKGKQQEVEMREKHCGK